jgi:hypothetical protein
MRAQCTYRRYCDSTQVSYDSCLLVLTQMSLLLFLLLLLVAAVAVITII